jgi:hypothetical protein
MVCEGTSSALFLRPSAGRGCNFWIFALVALSCLAQGVDAAGCSERGGNALDAISLAETESQAAPQTTQVTERSWGRLREFTLDHPRPESRTRWRVAETYLSRFHEWNRLGKRITLLVVDAALPDMKPWWTSGLDLNRDDDLQRRVSIAIHPSYDFGTEKRTLPHMLKQYLEPDGEYLEKFYRYRLVWRNSEGETKPAVGKAFYLIPKVQLPGRVIHFRCEVRCTAFTDFSETVALQYGLALELIPHWTDVDAKIRILVRGMKVD